MDDFTRNGMVFDVRDEGPADGEVIVLLHGYPETKESWDAVIPLLAAAGYRVVAPDQRGYSPRARPRGRWAYRTSELALDIVALLDAAGVGRAHVVGHDWGGAVAWALAMEHADRLATMTSLSTPHPRALMRSTMTSTQLLHSWYIFFFQLPLLPDYMATGPNRRFFKRTLVKSGLASEKVDYYLSVIGEPKALRAAINWYRAAPFSRPGRADRITVPTMYVYSTGDFALGRKAADLTGRYVAGPYRYEILEGVSHWIPEERPDDVARLVLDHIKS